MCNRVKQSLLLLPVILVVFNHLISNTSDATDLLAEGTVIHEVTAIGGVKCGSKYVVVNSTLPAFMVSSSQEILDKVLQKELEEHNDMCETRLRDVVRVSFNVTVLVEEGGVVFRRTVERHCRFGVSFDKESTSGCGVLIQQQGVCDERQVSEIDTPPVPPACPTVAPCSCSDSFITKPLGSQPSTSSKDIHADRHVYEWWRCGVIAAAVIVASLISLILWRKKNDPKSDRSLVNSMTPSLATSGHSSANSLTSSATRIDMTMTESPEGRRSPLRGIRDDTDNSQSGVGDPRLITGTRDPVSPPSPDGSEEEALLHPGEGADPLSTGSRVGGLLTGLKDRCWSLLGGMWQSAIDPVAAYLFGAHAGPDARPIGPQDAGTPTGDNDYEETTGTNDQVSIHTSAPKTTPTGEPGAT